MKKVKPMQQTSETCGQTQPSAAGEFSSRPRAAALIIIGGLASIVLAMGMSVSFGAADVELKTIWEAIFHYNPDNMEHQIIQTLRLPRVVGGAIVGACFAAAGAIMQGMTRNPLADSSLLGLNAGAGLMLSVCFAFFPGLSFNGILLFSFLGAGLGAVLVYGIASLAKGGLSPVRLVLAGAAISALLNALNEGVSLYFQVGQDTLFWYAAGVSGVKWEQIAIMLPWFAAALLGAIMISRSITALNLGEDVALGLGVRTGWVKLAGAAIVFILAGSAVALVGGVGFVGLMVPHLARKWVGMDYRWIIPCSAILGSLLVVFADLAARMIHPPYETPIAALTAAIGVPFFLYLARKERREL
jgi:iron complex transport system permease protein